MSRNENNENYKLIYITIKIVQFYSRLPEIKSSDKFSSIIIVNCYFSLHTLNIYIYIYIYIYIKVR